MGSSVRLVMLMFASKFSNRFIGKNKILFRRQANLGFNWNPVDDTVTYTRGSSFNFGLRVKIALLLAYVGASMKLFMIKTGCCKKDQLHGYESPKDFSLDRR